MKNFLSAWVLLFSLGLSTVSAAGTAEINGMKIKKLRAVGDYPTTTFDNTLELWFTVPIVWPETVTCNATYRVYVDAKHGHIISAAYMAFATGKLVNFHVDDTLPVRHGSCEITFLDVNG